VRNADQRGIALLEVLIALVLLATIAEAGIRLLLEASDQARRISAAERAIVDESRLLSAITLLSRADLEDRLGIRESGPYKVEISRVSKVIYRIRLTESSDPRWGGLETILYRKEQS
jgi:type II secretory pathway pseudopilin PulG